MRGLWRAAKSCGRRWRQLAVLACLLGIMLGGCSVQQEPERASRMGGVWVQARSIDTPAEADATLARAEAGRFDAMFVNVLASGSAYYESALLPKHPDVAPGYDPLDYVVERAHQRGIAVHAWLVAGPMDYRDDPGPVFEKHPEWAMMGPDGKTIYWLNYTRPDVRRFIGDLALEIIRGYAVDGVHFDYTRYPGPEWGYDPYSLSLVPEEVGLDPEELRYAELPACGSFSGNPLLWPDTAQVLAEFDNGQPAVVLNAYGAGQVVLLNWDAMERRVAAESEILGRAIGYLRDSVGGLYILRSEATASRYGAGPFQSGLRWLRDLGWQPSKITESELAALNPGDVVVLPAVYVLGGQAASDLADFVHRGGSAIFIDGPTPSIWDRNVRAVTGMRFRGTHFRRSGLLLAKQEHDILPTSGRAWSLEECQARDAPWRAFRAEGITQLLQEVTHRVKQEAPAVVVSITVSSSQETLAEEHMLDWQTWLEEGTVDLIIPRAYVEADERLAPVLASWQPSLKDSGRILIGLKAHSGDKSPKTAQRVLSEIAESMDEGSPGVVLFDLEHTSDALLEALATGPFSTSKPLSGRPWE